MRFQFIDVYFKKRVLNDFDNNLFINISENVSFDIKEEDYSLRIETYVGKIHRKYALEHHLNQRHKIPHLQFKFNSENRFFLD